MNDELVNALSAETKVHKKYIKEILPQIPDDKLDLLIDRFINHLKYKEIAEKRNLTLYTVSTRVQTILSKIKKYGMQHFSIDIGDCREFYQKAINNMMKRYYVHDHIADINDFRNIDIGKANGIDYVLKFYFTDQERSIFNQYYIYGYTITKIAKLNNLSMTKVSNMIYKTFSNYLYQYRVCYCHGYNDFVEKMDKYLINDNSMPIEYLFIKNIKAYNVLIKNGIYTVYDLKKRNLKDIEWIGTVFRKRIKNRIIDWRDEYRENQLILHKNVFSNI